MGRVVLVVVVVVRSTSSAFVVVAAGVGFAPPGAAGAPTPAAVPT